MRLGLRGRLMITFVLAALLPLVAVGLWARGVLVDLAGQEHERRAASTVVAARDRIEQRTRSDVRALEQLCQRDYALRSLIDHTLAGERGAPLDRGAWQGRAQDLRRVLGLDSLEVRVVSAPGLRTGALLLAAPTPLRGGGADPALVRQALATEGAFVAPIVTADAGRTRALITACEARREGGALAVLGARVLDETYVRSLLGDVTPIELRPADRGTPAAGEGRLVHTFTDAGGAPAVHVVANLDGDPLGAELARLDQGFLVAAAGALLLALLVGTLLSLATTRPLRELEQAAQRVGAGDLESTIGGHHGGEVGDALEAFNRMTRELKRTRAKLLRAERIAAWRDIARRIAHEIKNPLSPIQVSIETMRKTYAKRHPDFDEIFEESTQTILEEVERLKRIVTEFSQFARMPKPQATPLDVREVVEHVVGLHRDGGVDISVRAGEVPEVRADREQLTQVVSNLLLNAVEASRSRHGDRGGRVVVTIDRSLDGSGVALAVEDDGPGVPEAERDRIFEPYFTTKEGGTGLGLAIVHRIVLDHGGEIDVQPSEQGGARFQVVLRPEGPPPEADASMTDSALPLVSRRDRT